MTAHSPGEYPGLCHSPLQRFCKLLFQILLGIVSLTFTRSGVFLGNLDQVIEVRGWKLDELIEGDMKQVVYPQLDVKLSHRCQVVVSSEVLLRKVRHARQRSLLPSGAIRIANLVEDTELSLVDVRHDLLDFDTVRLLRDPQKLGQHLVHVDADTETVVSRVAYRLRMAQSF